MATSGERAGLRDELGAVLVRYRRRISDLGGVVPQACVDELVAVVERHAGGQAPATAGRRPARRQVEPAAGPAETQA